MSSEGDYTPHPRPKPLTRRQLREMQEKFAKVSQRLDEVKELEKKHDDGDINEPKWV